MAVNYSETTERSGRNSAASHRGLGGARSNLTWLFIGLNPSLVIIPVELDHQIRIQVRANGGYFIRLLFGQELLPGHHFADVAQYFVECGSGAYEAFEVS